MRELLLNLPQINNNITLSIRFDAPNGHKINPMKFLKYEHKQAMTAFLLTFSNHPIKPMKHDITRLVRFQGKMGKIDNYLYAVDDGGIMKDSVKNKRSIVDNELPFIVKNNMEKGSNKTEGVNPTFSMTDFRKRKRKNHFKRRIPKLDSTVVWNQVSTYYNLQIFGLCQNGSVNNKES